MATDSKDETLQNVRLIAVMGLTGSGKTTFVNLASGSNLEIGYGLESCTCEVQLSHVFRIDDKPVILIDAPGFDDTTRSEHEILKLITEFLATIHLKGKKLSGIVFLHRISDDRMGGVAVKNVRLFRRLCGEEPLKNVVVATNRWGAVSQAIGEKRERELATNERFFKLALDNGTRLVRHSDTVESAHNILRLVLSLPPVVLHIQKELVEEHKHLPQTDVGMTLDEDLEKRGQEIRAEMSELQKEIQALKSDYLEEKRAMQKEREETNALLVQLQKQMQEMQSKGRSSVVGDEGQLQWEQFRREIRDLKDDHADVLRQTKRECDNAWTKCDELRKELRDREYAHERELKEIRQEQEQAKTKLESIQQEREKLSETQFKHEEKIEKMEKMVDLVHTMDIEWREKNCILM